MRTISISAKCSDLFSAALRQDGKEIGLYEGYVPAFIPNKNVQHYGDYVEMEIDIETGQILNWKKPSQNDLTIFETIGKVKE